MRRTGEFRSPEHRRHYTEKYDAAMREGPVPDKELDVDTAFGTTRVYRYGDGDGTPLVLLPALAATAACWAPLVGDLAEHHSVYVVDTMGEAGMSVQTAPLRGHADRARWFDEVLARLDLTGVHLVGGSSGGYYAMWQAIHEPARLASVTLIDPTQVTSRFAAKVIWLGLFATVVNRDSHWRRFMHWSAGTDVHHRPDVQLILAGIKNFRPRLPPPGRPPADAISAVTLPMLALFAGRGTAHDGPRAADRFRELLPHADVELWPETGHLMWLEERDRVRIVDRILRHTGVQ